jgi:membrane protease subunit HflK
MENNGRPRPSNPGEISPVTIKKIAIGVVIVAILAWGSTMFYTVQEQEAAAVLTFGKVTQEIFNPGLQVKLPTPIQTVKKVPANKVQKLTVGYTDTAEPGGYTTSESDALMITGDENIVYADATIQYKISNIQNYLYNVRNPEEFLKNSASASIRTVIGSKKLDYAITDGKTEIQNEVKEKLIELQDKYQTGIQIVEVLFQDIEPPDGSVQDAFRNVTNAREQKNTKINEANKYQNEVVPVARGKAKALVESAEGEKAARIANANGDVAKFNALYNAYKLNPGVTKQRLVLETLEQIYPNAKIIISDGAGDTVKYLPLNELLNTKTTTPPANTTPAPAPVPITPTPDTNADGTN